MKQTALLLAFAALALCPLKAKADIQTWVSISSDVFSTVGVTSNTPVEVDNLNMGVTYTLAGRNQIVLSFPKSAPAFGCQFSTAGASAGSVILSTQTSPTVSPNLGVEYDATTTQSLQVTVPLPSFLSYWCQSYSSSATIHVDQQRPIRSPSFTPPN